MIERIVWVLGLIGPAALVMFVVLRRRPDMDRNRIYLLASVAAFSLGAAGSYAAGARMIGALFGSGEIEATEFAKEWRQMWYPLAAGLGASFVIALRVAVTRRAEQRRARADAAVRADTTA